MRSKKNPEQIFFTLLSCPGFSFLHFKAKIPDFDTIQKSFKGWTAGADPGFLEKGFIIYKRGVRFVDFISFF